MKTNVKFGEGGTFRLSAAILLYGEGSAPDSQPMATVHAVQHDDHGRATILPGHAPDPAAIQDTLLALMQRKPAGLLPANLLFLSLTCMIWHRPAAPAALWFQVNRGSKELNKMSGETVPHPHLLFMVDGGQVFVFALATPGRPDGDTPLYRAPYYNVSDNGNLCIGSARMPHDLHPDAIPKYEAGFFDSRFTHPTGSGKLSGNPGGHDKLWPALLKRKTFPVQALLRQAHLPRGGVPVRIRPPVLRNLIVAK